MKIKRLITDLYHFYENQGCMNKHCLAANLNVMEELRVGDQTNPPINRNYLTPVRDNACRLAYRTLIISKG